MEAFVKTLEMPVTTDTAQTLYVVVICQTSNDGYYHPFDERTFGVYTEQNVADFVAEKIISGEIKPVY